MGGSRTRMPADPFTRRRKTSTRTRPARLGLRARSRHGEFSQTWWGRRWIELLEGFGWTERLQRGRRYARSGQVLDLSVRPGR
ncbi:MAG: SWIM zinc finger family protein, partial [Thermoplasmata archaeon]